ncbi:Cytochrome b5-like Heme/Steroid binding domain family protein [Clavispora lusitaniae]|uniref:Cytochrome b5-like Heme/Steroid binding domain family protein n=1 Tax=Clavispora lusitaniae TaxID=36911 RepID=UPI00202C751D|nr:Cytochrome b5-like Heme/Steroid binding domain family protein [Clavispora lusitaniae]
MASGVRVRKRVPDGRSRKRLRSWRRIHVPHLLSISLLPLCAVCYLVHMNESLWPSNSQTALFCSVYYVFCNLAFSMGYHKYYAHQSFQADFWVEVYFVIFGASVGLGSARKWAMLHRLHHRCTDETDDPYWSQRGFLWAHWGWLLAPHKHGKRILETILTPTPDAVPGAEESKAIPNRTCTSDADASATKETASTDIFSSPILLWQERWVWPLFALTTIVIPSFLAVYVCHDSWVHGLIYPGILRMFACQQAMLSAESLGHRRHLFSSQPFSDSNSSMDCANPIVSLLTFGQAHHNFHHEFPHDYRGAPSRWSFDPTKWGIWALSQIGAVHAVYRAPQSAVQQLLLQQEQKELDRVRASLHWGTPLSRLPRITPREFRSICADDSRLYIVISNIIHDVTPFMDQHPGGPALLHASRGKDATKAFYGGVYGHSAAAVNLLATMRIGILDGHDDDVWRIAAHEESGTEPHRAGSKTAEAA